MGAHSPDNTHLRSEIIGHIKKGGVPVKFMYTEKGAENHIRFAEKYPEEYLDGRCRQEIRAIAHCLGPTKSPAQICDIGCSNGVHTVQFLQKYTLLNPHTSRYLGVDVSPRLLQATESRIPSRVVSESAFSCWDVEEGVTHAIEAWRFGGPVLMCLFGSTLGNVENPASVLRNIRHSSQAGDSLALGLFSPARAGTDESEAYRTAPIREMVTEPLRIAGIPNKYCSLRIESIGGSVLGTVRITHPVTLEGVHLAQGYEIRCFLSRRYLPDDIRRLLKSTGWNPIYADINEISNHFVVVARHQRV